MIGKHTCAIDPKKIISLSLPPSESCTIHEPQTGILHTSPKSSVIIRRRNDSRQPLIDLVWANDESEVAELMCPNTLIAVGIYTVVVRNKRLVSSSDVDRAIFCVDRWDHTSRTDSRRHKLGGSHGAVSSIFSHALVYHAPSTFCGSGITKPPMCILSCRFGIILVAAHGLHFIRCV